MPELDTIFAELGISHYLTEFVEQGFDTWDTILDITESDFDALGVKLGHRRKLQRRIANFRGVSADRALASPRPSPGFIPDEIKSAIPRSEIVKDASSNGASNGTSNGNTSGTISTVAPHGAKRKYRRHPKPDENAPERPPSAYVIFSNKMREELKGRNLSFTEIAKLVGENWQNLSPLEKEPFEQQAFGAKERYNIELAEYKKTEHYKEYSQYLVEFKSKHSSSQQGMPAESAVEAEVVKRPKLEAHPSTTSSGTGSSSASQNGGDIIMARGRVGSSASINGQWLPSDLAGPTIMPKLALAFSASQKPDGSPGHVSPTVLPGYRDSISKPHQPLPWREAQRDEVLQQSRPSSAGSVGFQQHFRRSEQHQPPPLLTSESTNSTVSSAYFTPRTPLEPPLERALPMPTMYYQKNSFDNQLAPLRPPSLSPQTSTNSQQLSPNGTHSWDYSPSLSTRGYFNGQQKSTQPDPDARYRDSIPHTASDEDLIPISALLSLANGNGR